MNKSLGNAIAHTETPSTQNPLSLMDSTTNIVCSYLENNKDKQDINVHQLIEEVYATLARLKEENDNMVARLANGQRPAVAIEDSIQPDYVVCLEDGSKLKMLKRYLKTHYDMTPEQYRRKWGLPATYPMTAPNYAKKRSQLAKEIGLGKKR